MEIDLEKVYIYIQKLVIVIKVYIEFISLQSMLSFTIMLKSCYKINGRTYFSFSGDYVNNKKEGNGIFWWTSGSHAGDRYEGEFKGDKR